MEVIDNLQCLLESRKSTAPVMIVGDMNTGLPQKPRISLDWYKNRPFSKRSLLLYDFLCENELCVGNFAFNQDYSYTYFKKDINSYIDHVFLSSYAMKCVVKCVILPHEADNVSDHLPISTEINLVSKGNKDMSSKGKELQIYPKGYWSDPVFQKSYAMEVENALKSCVIKDMQTVTEKSAGNYINSRSRTICEILHTSVERCLLKYPPKKKFRNKPWWNKECFKARRRNRLFHYLWKEAGRPSSSNVYETYKSAKRHYRQTCHKAMQNKIAMPFKTLDRLHSAKNSKQFWNIVRKSKKNDVQDDAISNSTLTEYL